MMELFWTPEAIQDRSEIYDYIEADNPVAALTLDELFAEKARYLVDHPGLGRPAASQAPASWWCIRITFWSMMSPATGCACCGYCTLPGNGRQAVVDVFDHFW